MEIAFGVDFKDILTHMKTLRKMKSKYMEGEALDKAF